MRSLNEYIGVSLLSNKFVLVVLGAVEIGSWMMGNVW